MKLEPLSSWHLLNGLTEEAHLIELFAFCAPEGKEVSYNASYEELTKRKAGQLQRHLEFERSSKSDECLAYHRAIRDALSQLWSKFCANRSHFEGTWKDSSAKTPTVGYAGT
jgi:hypothetical protein